jgi:hypothetical protein
MAMYWVQSVILYVAGMQQFHRVHENIERAGTTQAMTNLLIKLLVFMEALFV